MAMGDAEKQAHMRGQKTLEINPYHPLIQELKAKHEAEGEGERAAMLALLLYETALLESGFQLADNKAFNRRVYALVKDVLHIKTDLSSVNVPAEDPAEDEDDEEVVTVVEEVAEKVEPVTVSAVEEKLADSVSDGKTEPEAADDGRDEL